MLDIGCLMLDVGYWVLDIGCYAGLGKGLLEVGFRELVETMVEDGLADSIGQINERVEIVDREEGGAKHLFDGDEMPEIGPGEVLTGVTGTTFYERIWIFGVFGLTDVDAPSSAERGFMSRQASRQHAVEDIYPA